MTPTTYEVLLFGPLSARLGRSSVRIRLDEPAATCGVLRDRLARSHPDVADLLPVHRFARNQEMVPDDTEVRPGDEIALVGMVSGG